MAYIEVILTLWLRVHSLAEHAHDLAPKTLTITAAHVHALAAVAASTSKVSPEMLLAIAYAESKYREGQESRQRTKRGRLSLFCGYTQAAAKDDETRCAALQGAEENYAAMAREMTRWLRTARGNVRRALAGHGCGIKMPLTCGSYRGRKRPYVTRVMAAHRKLIKSRGGQS